MSLVPTIYSSTDSGAPALTGQVGSLAALLDAVLVDGYGVGLAAKAGAGWTRAFSATNKRAFRNNPVTATGGYLRVDDTATVSGSNARYALCTAFKTMSDIDAGADQAPTVTQLTNGVIIPKSGTLDGTARAWLIIANERFAYFFVNASASTSNGMTGIPFYPSFFGDFVTLKPGDVYNFAIISNQLTTYTGSGATAIGLFQGAGALNSTAAGQGGWALRSHTGAAGAVQIAGVIDAMGMTHKGGSSGGGYPNAVSGGLVIDKLLLKEGAAHSMRGYLPNVYGPGHNRPFADGSIKTDVQGLPAGTQLYVKDYSYVIANAGGSDTGQVLFDMTNSW